jgi:hypothetical protein
MLRRGDPDATVAEGTLIETDAGPIPALALKRELERITVLGYEKRLRLTRLDAGWLRRSLIPTIPTGLAGQLPPVSV